MMYYSSSSRLAPLLSASRVKWRTLVSSAALKRPDWLRCRVAHCRAASTKTSQHASPNVSTAKLPAAGAASGAGGKLQPVDYTTLVALCTELNQTWVPAKVEEVSEKRRAIIYIYMSSMHWWC